MAELIGIAESIGLDRILITPAAEYVRVITIEFLECFAADWIKRDLASDWIIGIVPHGLLEAGLQCSPLLETQGSIIGSARLFCPVVKDEHTLAVQPVRAPVGGNVSAVPPNRAHLLATD